MENKNGHELVPLLINKVNLYSDKLKDRVKIDEIFNEIDLYASDGFKKFIQMSYNRYKCVKSGIDLNSVLEKQKNEYKELSDNILTNNFYTNNEIDKESKKLFHKVGIKESKELCKIRKNIIIKNKTLSPTKLIKRKNNEIKKFINFKKEKNNTTIKTEKNTNQESNINTNENENEEITNDNNDNFVQNKKKYLSDIVEMDNQFVNSNIESYKNFLKDIEKTKDNSKILRIMSRNDSLGHKYSFKINNIKLLSFREEKKKDEIKKKKVEDNTLIDIKKLIKYTKRGNRKWFEEQLKQKSFKRLDLIKKNLKRNEAYSDEKNKKKINNRNYSLLNKNDFNYNSRINCNESNRLHGKINLTNFISTINIVKNEAKLITNIRENFDKKRETVNHYFKNNSLPELDVCQIKQFLKKSHGIISPAHKKEGKKIILTKLKKDIKNEMIENDEKLKEIYDMYKNTYYSKLKSWSLEQKRQKGLKEKEKEKCEDNKKYLNEINSVKRKAQLFSDVYSLRDGIVNERIKLFNRSLNGPIYSKENMRNKINDFTNYIESKEKERRINEELLKKKQKEEEIKSKEEDIGYQVLLKMKKNLNLNNNIKTDEENIDFNYRYISNQKKNRKSKKNISEQAFKDYLEALKFVKAKKVINMNEDK